MTARLLQNLGDDASANRVTTLADGEAEAFLHGNVCHEGNGHHDVVARHGHFLTLREGDGTGHGGGTEVELGFVAGEEGLVTATFCLGQDIDLCLELRVRGNGTGLADDLPTAHFVVLDATEQQTNVIACLTVVEQLVEHLDAGDNGLAGLFREADDFDVVRHLDDPTLNTTCRNSAAAGDREDILDSKQERLVGRTDGGRDVAVDGVHKLPDLVGPLVLATSTITFVLHGLEGGTTDDWGCLTIEVVLRQEVTNFHLDKVDEFGIVNLVYLVEEDDDPRNVDLVSEQEVFASLRHGAFGCGDNKDSTIHLGGTSDHVLDVIRVARAIDVRIMTLLGFILSMVGVDRDAAGFLFRSVIDLVVPLDRRMTQGREALGDGSSQCRLAMVNVTDGSDVDVRLVTLKFLFRHYNLP